MAGIRLYAYADRLSVKAGDKLSFMISAEGSEHVDAQMVRLLHGDEHPGGPGFQEAELAADVNGSWPVNWQFTQKGNFLTVADEGGHLAPQGSFTLHAFIFPTLPGAGRQVLISRFCADARTGYAFGINENGCLAFWSGNGARIGEAAMDKPLLGHTWYCVAASLDAASGSITLRQKVVINRYNSLLSKIVPLDYDAMAEHPLLDLPHHAAALPFIIGGMRTRHSKAGFIFADLYNGKIDRCGVQKGTIGEQDFAALAGGGMPPAEAMLAYWDPSIGYTDQGIGDMVADRGLHGLAAKGVNRPVRGQTGWNWNGRDDNFRLAPEQYGAIEFHDDALTDCGWQPTFHFTVPADWKSAVYALRLRAGGAEEYVPFFVRAAQPKAPICLLVPTASYLAYANMQSAFESGGGQAVNAVLPVFQPIDLELCEQGFPFGLSTYDRHSGGSGVCYSSYRRPIANMRPKYRMPGVACAWGFPADLSIVAWLDRMGYEWELITDEDLHREGAAALKPYRVVINGTHCEYYSERMLDATEDYLSEGGRLTYLSGNGYYWVVGFREDEAWILETRRLDGGTRAWQARAGEQYLASTGERGGLWRHRNRAPQKLVGTGFAAAGMEKSEPYRRLPDGFDPALAWIFDGVAGDIFGDFGMAYDGAAGSEIDRYDRALGSPPNARIVATANTFPDSYPLVQEDVMFMRRGMGGSEHPRVRCDMVYFETRQGGAVFAPSSIAWGSALPWNDFDNDVSRIMKNVIDAFSRPGLKSVGNEPS